MVNQDIVRYLREGVNRGFNISLLRQELLRGGFNARDVDEAIAIIRPSKPVQKPVQNKPQKQIQTSSDVKNDEKDNEKSINREDYEEKTSPDKNKDMKPKTSIVMKIDKEKAKPIDSNLGLFSKIGKSIVHPGELFERTKGDGIGKVLLYYFVIALVPFIIMSLILFLAFNFVMELVDSANAAAGVTLNTDVSVWYVIGGLAGLFFIISPILLFVSSGVLHLILRLYGGKGSYGDSFGVMIYSHTPSILLFFILPITGIWTFILTLIGYSKVHEIGVGRAFLAELTLWLIATIIGVSVILLFG